jgi:hypothetical protein
LNWEEVLDPEYGLQQDDWSLHGGADGGPPVFGESGELKVVGWSGRNKPTKGAKYYILQCSVCKQDSELFGAGLFKSTKSNLQMGRLACGCGNIVYSTQQWILRTKRVVIDRGYSLVEPGGSVCGNTKITVTCEAHGSWVTKATAVVSGNFGCRGCANDFRKKKPLFVGEYHQDSFSANNPRFGKMNQLEVRGYLPVKQNGITKYIVKCHICSKDTELYGDGIFYISKGSLDSGHVPCGCSYNPKMTTEQWGIVVSRHADNRGYTFRGFLGEWDSQRTKLSLICPKHGEWGSATIGNFVANGHGCPSCANDVVGETKKKPDDIMVKSFFDSGAFHPDTKFWRSLNRASYGNRVLWCVECPDCGVIGESVDHNLRKGCRPCACNNQRQQECYINWIVDNRNNAVGIKFGIARDSKRRVKDQNRQSIYEIRQYQVYTFPTVQQCKAAERECKKELICGVISKTDMLDGWTETTCTSNLARVKSIYEKNGGVLKDE